MLFLSFVSFNSSSPSQTTKPFLFVVYKPLFSHFARYDCTGKRFAYISFGAHRCCSIAPRFAHVDSGLAVSQTVRLHHV